MTPEKMGEEDSLLLGDIPSSIDEPETDAVFRCVLPPLRLSRTMLAKWLEQGLITAEDINELDDLQ